MLIKETIKEYYDNGHLISREIIKEYDTYPYQEKYWFPDFGGPIGTPVKVGDFPPYDRFLVTC